MGTSQRRRLDKTPAQRRDFKLFFFLTRSSQWRHVGSKLANSLSIDYAPGSVIRQEKMIIKMYLVPTFSSNPTRHISVHLQMVTRGPASLVIIFDKIHFEIKHLNVMGGFI